MAALVLPLAGGCETAPAIVDAAADAESTISALVGGDPGPAANGSYTLTWDFENVTSRGRISSATAATSDPRVVTGFASQTGGGPVDTLGTAVVHMTRRFGPNQNHPFIDFTTSQPTTLRSLAYHHIHSHTVGYPTHPSYDVQLQIDDGSGFVDIGSHLTVSAANSGSTAVISLGDLELGAGTYRIRWIPRNLRGVNTMSDFFAMRDVTLSLTTAPADGNPRTTRAQAGD